MRVEHLPPGGPYYRALHDGSYWTDREHLLAEIVDTVAAYGAGSIRAAGAKIRRPRPIKRPGQTRSGRIGDTSGHDPVLVITYLHSLAPPPRAARPTTGA